MERLDAELPDDLLTDERLLPTEELLLEELTERLGAFTERLGVVTERFGVLTERLGVLTDFSGVPNERLGVNVLLGVMRCPLALSSEPMNLFLTLFSLGVFVAVALVLLWRLPNPTLLPLVLSVEPVLALFSTGRLEEFRLLPNPLLPCPLEGRLPGLLEGRLLFPGCAFPKERVVPSPFVPCP